MFESIKNDILKLEGRLGIVIRDIRSGESLRMGEDQQFAAASVIKLPIMWEFFRRAAQGELELNTTYLLRDSVKVGVSRYDSGILREMHDGMELTYLDILTLMIIISDDTATNILLDLLGMDSITDEMKRLGLEKTHVNRRMMDYEKVQRGIDNWATAGDMDRLLDVLLKGEILPECCHGQMLDLMAKQQINTAIPLFLSPQLKIAHKTGCIVEFELEHDVGIVYDRTGIPALAVSAFSQHLPHSREVIGRIAAQAFQEIQDQYLC